MDEGQLIERNAREREDELHRMLGALGFASRLTDAVSEQTLQGLDYIKQTKSYTLLNFKTFDDFLDHHPHSPMKAEMFRRRWNLLKAEGGETFNLLNSLNVPLGRRKLLAGQVRVEGDEVVIQRDGGEDRVPMSDHLQVKRVLALVAEERDKALTDLEEKKRTNERLTKKLKQGEVDFDKLKRQAVIANPDGTESGHAVLALAGAYKRLCETLEAAPDAEKRAVRDPIFDLMAANQLNVGVALGVISKEQAAVVSVSDEEIEVSDDEAADLLGD